MTREAVIDGFEEFISEAITETMAEFSVTRALQNGVQGPGSRTVDRLVKETPTIQQEVVEPQLRSYRDQTVNQFNVILDYAESDDPIDAYRQELLDVGAFASEIRTGIPERRQQQAREALIERHRQLGDAVVPLLESPESTFWGAARDALTADESNRLVETHFAFSQPIQEYSDAYALSTELDLSIVLGRVGRLLGDPTIEVEYTDEALRALQRAEQQVIHNAKQEIATKFES